MSVIEVVYENGVFRPLEPIQLPEGARAQVNVGGADTGLKQAGEPFVGEELAAFLDQVATLPYTAPTDSRTDVSTHHDSILYPKNGRLP